MCRADWFLYTFSIFRVVVVSLILMFLLSSCLSSADMTRPFAAVVDVNPISETCMGEGDTFAKAIVAMRSGRLKKPKPYVLLAS